VIEKVYLFLPLLRGRWPSLFGGSEGGALYAEPCGCGSPLRLRESFGTSPVKNGGGNL